MNNLTIGSVNDMVSDRELDVLETLPDFDWMTVDFSYYYNL